MGNQADVEKMIHYTFGNAKYLEEAMTAAGTSSSNNGPGKDNGNKRLALVGDALIRLIILDEWYPEGTSTEKGSNLVSSRGSNQNLNEIGAECGFSRYIKLNPCQKGAAPPTTMASTVEAIIGAVWEDSGKDLDRVRGVVRALHLTE
ncbi:hypothetical protein LTS17_001900 [Exophiala oligosperma]